MKQIALAVLQYEMAQYKMLPPAGTGYGWCCVDTEGGLNGSPMVFLSDPHIVNQNGLSLLLAYLGQEGLDASLDRAKAFSLAASPYGNLWPTSPFITSERIEPHAKRFLFLRRWILMLSTTRISR